MRCHARQPATTGVSGVFTFTDNTDRSEEAATRIVYHGENRTITINSALQRIYFFMNPSGRSTSAASTPAASSEPAVLEGGSLGGRVFLLLFFLLVLPSMPGCSIVAFGFPTPILQAEFEDKLAFTNWWFVILDILVIVVLYYYIDKWVETNRNSPGVARGLLLMNIYISYGFIMLMMLQYSLQAQSHWLSYSLFTAGFYSVAGFASTFIHPLTAPLLTAITVIPAYFIGSKTRNLGWAISLLALYCVLGIIAFIVIFNSVASST
jgi:hypothetical protein